MAREDAVEELLGGPWPCVIVRTRYTGTYERGRWAAFQAVPADLVGEDWAAGDVFAAPWWKQREGGIGVGDSPTAAYEALAKIAPALRWRPKPSERRR